MMTSRIKNMKKKKGEKTMKTHQFVAMTYITRNYTHVFKTGAYNLQSLFKYTPRDFYNAGQYGWNCDIYVDNYLDLAICTGYRNTRGIEIPNDIIQKYTEKAEEIDLFVDYNFKMVLFNELVRQFTCELHDYANNLEQEV